MNKQELAEAITAETTVISAFLNQTPEALFNTSIEGKWTIAENVVHLSKSVRPINISLSLPKVSFAIFGKGNGSRSYDEIVAAYTAQLDKGAKASLPYVPWKGKTHNARTVTDNFESDYKACVKKFTEWDQEDLDSYRLPHPIIGNITFTEMLEFTLYHMRHHLETMRSHAKQLS